MIDAADIVWLSDAICSLYSAQTLPELVRASMSAIDAHFNLLASACEEVSYEGSVYTAHGLRCSVAAPRDYAAFLHDHPLMPLIEHGPSAPLLHLRGDFAENAWRKTDHFNGVARPMGWNDQLLIIAQPKPTTAMVGLYRDVIFSRSERELIGLLQPHLAACWQRVSGPTAATKRVEPLYLRKDLRPQNLSVQQREILRSYFPQWRSGEQLPAPLRDWTTACVDELAHRPLSRPLRAFGIAGPRGRLLVRCFPEIESGAIWLRLLETPANIGSPFSFENSLTPREREVLGWIAQGKRDGEIAVILGMATHTASKHVARILGKVQISSRAAVASLKLNS